MARLTHSNPILAELRTFGDKGDAWGSAMVALFDVAGELSFRGADVPDAWEYRPGACATDVRETDSAYFYVCEGASLGQLLDAGAFLHRYTDKLRAAGRDY